MQDEKIRQAESILHAVMFILALSALTCASVSSGMSTSARARKKAEGKYSTGKAIP